MSEKEETSSTGIPAPVAGGSPHDWEQIFESPENGFISLVKQAKTIDGLHECTHLIINSLFTRTDDATIRDAYEQALDDILPKGARPLTNFDKNVSHIVQLLREIKMHRQTKSDEYIRKKAAGKATGPESERRKKKDKKPLPGLEIQEILESPVPENDEQAIEAIFADMFCQRIKKRLDVLNQPSESNTQTGGPPPFILSKDFARHFDALLRQYFMPPFLEESRALVAHTAQQPPELRKQYLSDQFDGRVSSQNLWDRWKDTWSLLIHPRELPEKPEPEKKKGLLDGLKKKKKKAPSWMRKMTLDEWKVQMREIKSGNKKAKEIWALISAQSDTYQAPEFEDEKLLMDLFARSAEGLQNNIKALRQIAEQGGDVGRSLRSYAQRKDIDLALLAACTQFPDLFLGPQKALGKMLKGMDETIIARSFPLVGRYLKF